MILGNRSTLAFDVQPVAPAWSLRYPPESAAWAGFSLWVENENLCEHIEPGSDRVDQLLYLPLGPLADWFVRNWPAIAHEERPRSFPASLDPRRTREEWERFDPPRGMSPGGWYEERREWWTRHFIEAGAEGAVLPDLALSRDGGDLVVGWAAVGRPGGRRREGVAQIPFEEARETIQALVQVVSQSFREAGRAEVYPWCREGEIDLAARARLASGGLGLEWFTGRSAVELMDALGVEDSELLPDELGLAGGDDPAASIMTQILRDVGGGAGPEFIRSAKALMERAAGLPEAPGLAEPRRLGTDVCAAVSSPEEQGHEAARALRRSLGLGGEPLTEERLDAMKSTFGLDLRVLTTTGEGAPVRNGAAVHSLLGAFEGRGSAAELLPTWRLAARWARRFETARILGTCMLDPYRSGMLGRATSNWSSEKLRRRTGAFAAELLLPEEGIRARGFGHVDAALEPDCFSGLLKEFGVGARAAAFQLWNLSLLSSPDLRDDLIEEYVASES